MLFSDPNEMYKGPPQKWVILNTKRILQIAASIQKLCLNMHKRIIYIYICIETDYSFGKRLKMCSLNVFNIEERIFKSKWYTF